MFCDQCGAQITNGAQFCPACGKAMGNVTVIPRESRLTRHLRLLGIFWLAAGALNLLGAGGAWLAGSVILPALIRSGVPAFVPGILMAVAWFLFVKAVASFAAGYGLLEREPWARLLALVLGFVSLFHVPLGTALGIYTFWVLLPSQADEEYRRLARAA